MTGAMLRRIREAYGFSRAQVAEMSELSLWAISGIEGRGVSYARSSLVHSPGRNDHRQHTWGQYLNALRSLRVGRKPVIQSEPKPARCGVLKPSPDAVKVHRDDAWVWVKIANYGGCDYGFILRGREWVRSAWVEERFLGRKVTPRFAEGDEAYPDAGLARWRNGY